ncbi:MAG: tetratricopeptide repeat protein, partial [Planctomycetales bacterium]|nr:tetratricopeptide repeat protein [Planctomycetales bacterium]NIP69523.1 tetratricopeptide repeat protein [Planctomycetales bacterium]
EEVQLAIADLFDADGDFGAALAEYKELPARYPRSELAARASFQAGWCASRLQRFPDALTLFQQAFALASHSEHPAASAELAAQALFKVADVQVEVGALADAVGSYQRLISSYPNS